MTALKNDVTHVPDDGTSVRPDWVTDEVIGGSRGACSATPPAPPTR